MFEQCWTHLGFKGPKGTTNVLCTALCGRACSLFSIEIPAQVYGAITSCYVTPFVCSFGLSSQFMPCDPYRLVIFLTLSNWLLTDADIKASNILSEIEDECILAEFEAAEVNSPSAKVTRHDRTIYASRMLDLLKTFGLPVLCDFGVARFGDEVNNEDIQLEVYRAPEVILEMNWSYPVDIWNVGVMVYRKFCNRRKQALTRNRFGTCSRTNTCLMDATLLENTQIAIISPRW